MQLVHPPAPRGLVARTCAVALLAAVGCGDTTGSGTRLTLEAPDANVATYEVATAIVRGTTLTAESYDGALGAVAVTAARVNDSTVAIVIPPIPAGAHLLKLYIGTATAEATLQVSVTPSAENPAAYIAVVDSAIASEIAALDTSLAFVASGSISINEAAFTHDRAAAQASLDSARIAYAALTSADRQEVANILRATYGIEVGSASATGGPALLRGRAPDFCGDPDLPLTDAETQECADAAAADLRTFENDAVHCQSEAINAALGTRRQQIRTFFRHILNGCHLIRVANWALSTWAALQWPTVPEFDLFGQFDPDAYTGRTHAGIAPSLGGTAPALEFHGIDFYSFPVKMQFRPMVAGDVGKVAAATRLAGLLSDAAASWQRLNSHLAEKPEHVPATLAQITSAPWQTLTHTPNRVRLGAVQPQAIRWFWQQTATGLNLKFDADDRSQPISFTFDVIYDAGAHGADTIRIPAVLAVDSTRIYQAAVLGRWTGTFVDGYGTDGPGAVRPVDFRTNVFNWGPRVDIMTGAIIDPLRADGSCPSHMYKVGSTCENYFSWKIYNSGGRYYMEFGHFFGGTVTTTAFALPLGSFTVFADGKAKLRLAK